MDRPAARTSLQDLSLDLTALAARLADYTEADLRRSRNEIRVTAAQVRAVLAARHARSALFGIDLINPGWSLLLELYRADLEQRPVTMARLAAGAQVPSATAFRWITDLTAAGLVSRTPNSERPKGVIVALTDAGREAMEDHFVAAIVGWSQT